MLSLLLYLACAVLDPHQVELDRIVQMHKRMGHPALWAYGIDVNEHNKFQNYGYVFIWHEPSKMVISGDIVLSGGVRIKIVTMPEGVEPPARAKEGVKVK